MTTPILQVDGLVKHFSTPRSSETVHAVNGVSFEIAPGETLGLVGESGSGKSTIGRLVVRLLTPTGGAIRFSGDDISHLPVRRMRRIRSDIQIVFQDPWGSLNPRMRVGRLIDEILMLHTTLGSRERNGKVAELAERVHLSTDLLTRFPHELSGGQLQRVCIARAVATKPKLVVLDEPTSSLDLSVRAGILELLGELQRDSGVAMLFISHDLDTVRLVSNRILVLYLGSIVESGPAATVFNEPGHPYTQSLLSAHLPPDPRITLAHRRLEGEVPSPLNLPPGCPFASRCALAKPECRSASPPMHDLDGGSHLAACIRIAEGTNLLPA